MTTSTSSMPSPIPVPVKQTVKEIFMKSIFLVLVLAAQFSFAGITTPDNFHIRFEKSPGEVSLSTLNTIVNEKMLGGKPTVLKPTIVILDGGSLYSFVSVTLKQYDKTYRYGISVEADGSLSPLNQRILSTLKEVAAGNLTLKQIHTFDGKDLVAGDFSYKSIAAVSVGN